VKGQFLLAKGQASRAVFVLETRWLPGFLNTKIHDYVPYLSAIEAGGLSYFAHSQLSIIHYPESCQSLSLRRLLVLNVALLVS